MFNTMNLNTQASWYTDEKPEGRDISVLCLQQLEKNTFFVGFDRILRVCLHKAGGWNVVKLDMLGNFVP